MNIIDPSSINLLALPSVRLEERAILPTVPCVYLAIDNQGLVQYVGMSNNPRKRWQAHHRGIELALLGGVRIAYLALDASLLPEIERAMITHFCPPLNQPISDSLPASHAERKTRRSETAPLPPRNRRRKGDGTGYVYERIATKGKKEYKEFYYHYEVWVKGDRLLKKTKYIPKRLVAKIQEMEAEKVPVREILRLLGVELDFK